MISRSLLLLMIMIGAVITFAPRPSSAQEASPATAPAKATVHLGDLEPVCEHQGWGTLKIDTDVAGAPLSIAGRPFAHGLGAHANSEIVYDLSDAHYETFEAWVGIDDSMKSFKGGSVVFQVFGDGKKLFDSGVVRLNDPAKLVRLPVAGVAELKLVATDAGDGINCDHADWAAATLTGSALPPKARSAKYEVTAPGITVRLDESGTITDLQIGPQKMAWPMTASTHLEGCRPEGAASVTKLPNGGFAFSRQWLDAQQHACTLTDRFTPTANSIRWEIEIVSAGSPWTTDIATKLKYSATAATRFWTGWSDPDHQSKGWRDPLVLQPLSSTAWSFGGPTTHGDFTALPLATLAEPASDAGLSLVLSPEDTILNTRLTTRPSGAITFSRSNYRLGGGKPITFAMDITAHEADWRGGLRWLTTRYAQFFDPPNPHADALAGCGAYSGDENPIDVAKFKKMAFRINWKLSDDFPYMGMFIPPVKDADERWERSCDERAPSNKPRWTSCRRLNDYAKYMKDNGFYVLNYFNVTEFGKNMGGKPTAQPGDPDLWKDPRAFLTTQLPGAILRGGSATCYRASVVDPGDPAFEQFVLEQADRHIRWIPDSFGICIDRLDWLSHYNPNADDGVSWVNGKPARSLCLSWNNLLSKLGPRLHDADKVIFVNPIHSRLDLLRQVDGIYTEMGNTGPSLNASALMGLRKPVLAWSYNETLHQPDPDSFMQRHLLLGVYPTAPYPWNNHCMNPEPGADELFVAYGPLLDAMRGKKWVLAPHCVETSTPGVKVNMFQVPGGYVVPVTFGGKADRATVHIRNVSDLAQSQPIALQPGGASAEPVATVLKDGVLEMQVPLQRGCAMVCFKVKN